MCVIITHVEVRHAYFVNVLRGLGDRSMLVFTSTCKSCEELAILLRELGFACMGLHSQARRMATCAAIEPWQMSQQARLASLAQFKSNMVKILVATGTQQAIHRRTPETHADVASRGLDIPAVQAVVNFNVPKAVEDYVHRCDSGCNACMILMRGSVGRTARAGRGGIAITLVSEQDIRLVHAIEAHVGVKLQLYEAIKVGGSADWPHHPIHRHRRATWCCR